MNNMTASCLIHPHQFYTRCSPTLQLVLFYDVPQQVHLHGKWLGKRQHGCPSTWWPRGDPIGVIFFSPFFSFTDNACLGISFLLSISVPTAFGLQPQTWSKVFGLENHLSMYAQWPFPLILSHNLSTILNTMFVPS